MARRHFLHTPYAKQRATELRQNMTPSERHLWYDFLRGHDPRFLRQHPIGPYIVDFFCAEATLIVELDGDVHGTENGLEHDERRTHYLETHGFRILRFRSRDVFDRFEGVCEIIEKAVHDPTIKGRM